MTVRDFINLLVPMIKEDPNVMNYELIFKDFGNEQAGPILGTKGTAFILEDIGKCKIKKISKHADSCTYKEKEKNSNAIILK